MIGQVDGMVRVSKRFLSDRDYEDAAEQLLVVSRDEEKQLRLFTEHDKGLILPRSYAVRRFGLAELRDRMSYGSRIEAKFLWDLDEKKRNQLRITGEIMNNVKPGIGGQAQAPCGMGKTVMGIYCMTEWSVTTLVFVHTEFLAEQWEETIIDATDITIGDIGRIQRDTCDYKGKKVVIAITPSVTKWLAGKKKTGYPLDMLSWPGCVIFDEVHRYGAEMWHLAMGAFPAAYRLGLSATPERKDGMTPVISQHVGPLVSVTLDYQQEPKVYMLGYQTSVPYKSICLWAGGRPSSRVSLAKLQTRLAKDNRRNNMIADVLDACIDCGRKTIVLSDRLEQLRELEACLHNRGHTEEDVGFYIGGMDQHSRSVSSQKQVILATYALASEGLNIPALDTALLATPRANVEQSVGRILREHSAKQDPVVVDVTDRVSCTGLTTILADKRDTFYESKGWVIERVSSSQLLEALGG